MIQQIALYKNSELVANVPINHMKLIQPSNSQGEAEMKLVNLTPHAVVLQSADGSRTMLEPVLPSARISSTPGKPEMIEGCPVPVYTPAAGLGRD
jgi:hypothetical protein